MKRSRLENVPLTAEHFVAVAQQVYARHGEVPYVWTVEECGHEGSARWRAIGVEERIGGHPPAFASGLDGSRREAQALADALNDVWRNR